MKWPIWISLRKKFPQKGTPVLLRSKYYSAPIIGMCNKDEQIKYRKVTGEPLEGMIFTHWSRIPDDYEGSNYMFINTITKLEDGTIASIIDPRVIEENRRVENSEKIDKMLSILGEQLKKSSSTFVEINGLDEVKSNIDKGITSKVELKIVIELTNSEEKDEMDTSKQ